ncbi:unnamed protein product [Sphenostylis stenocarpa]|uniref:Protein kinase domain-containing protein n=1 Tax=Sphenostylis stenocarpa TaxID=92480 RepID=A0AA86W4G5_9FABA|nr:unnamed protein product [Sphenostylis stenocarpa]
MEMTTLQELICAMAITQMEGAKNGRRYPLAGFVVIAGIFAGKIAVALDSENIMKMELVAFSFTGIQRKKRKYVFQGKSKKEIEIEIPDLTASDKNLGIEDLEGDLKKENDLKVFNYATILVATNDFSAENKLGEGGFGPVYKGVLSTMKEVAIKRLSKSSGQGMVEFKNELTLISELQHMNLSDVYSFGVLLLEIVSGRRNTSFYDGDRPLNLIGHAWELWIEHEWLQLLDPSLSDSYVGDEVERCIHVGILCVQQYPNDRPTTSDIISMLTNKNVTVDLPKRPAFYCGRESCDENLSSKEFYTDSTKAIPTSTEI